MNTQIQDDNFKLLEESDYDRVDNTFKLYKGDVLINHRRDKLTQLLKEDDTKQSKTKSNTKSKTKSKTKSSSQEETQKTKTKSKTKSSSQKETQKTRRNKSSKSRKKRKERLKQKENILVRNFETNFENNFFVKRIKTVYTHVDSALSEINYKNSFVQIALILSFVYILTALIQTIHININY